MAMNLKLKQGAEEYRQKLKMGLIKKNKSLDPFEKAKLNPNSLRMAINAYCYDCCCEQKPEVKHCTAVSCPLYRLRPWQPSTSRL
jgi:hypothetical protein